jgi:uncharacterized protein
MLRFIRYLLITSCILLAYTSEANPGSKKNNSLLWRISSKELQKPSYLFGTMHLICQEDYIWTTSMEKSLQQSDAVCFELDLDDPGLPMEIASGLMDHSGKKLKDYFSHEDYKKLAQFIADSLKADISVFQQLKPVALQTIMGTNEIPCDSLPPVSYEVRIMEQVKETQKEVIGLETAAEQIDLFDNLPTDSIIKDLISIITQKDSVKDEYAALANAYKQQDIKLLHTIIQQSAQKDIDIAGFIDVRNEKWIKRMGEKMEQRSVFFAVGAGHLWGEYGLIKLLRAGGYTVEPVK